MAGEGEQGFVYKAELREQLRAQSQRTFSEKAKDVSAVSRRPPGPLQQQIAAAAGVDASCRLHSSAALMLSAV